MNPGEQPKKRDYAELKPYQYKPGQSGNPSGRPKGSKSLKEYARDMLSKMTDDEREEFMKGIDKRTIWEMGEGKAASNVDITSGGKEIAPIVGMVIKKDA